MQQHSQAAQAAEAQTGIPAAFMVGAGGARDRLGPREIRNADGTPSHNLFGIKAGAELEGRRWPRSRPPSTSTASRARWWRGSAPTPATPSRFADYARLMKDSPRYQPACWRSGAATPAASPQGLQRAGYATDPAYADKLTRVINTTLRLQRALT